MQDKKPQSNVPVFQEKDPPGTPKPAPDLSDMDRIHELAQGDHLANIMVKIARKVN